MVIVCKHVTEKEKFDGIVFPLSIYRMFEKNWPKHS
jgi:hypothetical protein